VFTSREILNISSEHLHQETYQIYLVFTSRDILNISSVNIQRHIKDNYVAFISVLKLNKDIQILKAALEFLKKFRN